MNDRTRVENIRTLQGLLTERAEMLYGHVAHSIPARLRPVLMPEDILQEVWIAMFQRISDVRPDRRGSLDRWLMAIVQRKLVDAIRRARRLKRGGDKLFTPGGMQRSSSYLDLLAYVISEHRSPSSETAAREAGHVMQIALSTLPQDCRDAIVLYHLHGQSRDQIAEVMQRTRPAVKGLLERGLRMLRERLGDADRFFTDQATTDRSTT